MSWNDIDNLAMPVADCHPLREDVSWNIQNANWKELGSRHPLREDVSWNINSILFFPRLSGHPLREDVSWNVNSPILANNSILSSSSWGCELKFLLVTRNHVLCRHPLREDVSWNIEDCAWPKRWFCHPLREDVSWNTNTAVQGNNCIKSSSSWGCELK